MILVDTSIWIDYFRGKPSREADYLKKLIGEDDDICICRIVFTEILQGIVSEREYKLTES